MIDFSARQTLREENVANIVLFIEYSIQKQQSKLLNDFL